MNASYLPEADSAHKQILDELSQAVDRELEDDRNWFASNPRRSIRVRRTFPNESRQTALLQGDVCPPGCRSYTISKQLEPGKRVRVLFFERRDFVLPVTEMGSRRLWERLADQQTRAAEAFMEKVV